jgi:hypothetical protein
MTTATVEATNHPITPTLLDVRVGDLVILETRRGMSYSRYIHPRLVSISQVDKRGRHKKLCCWNLSRRRETRFE